MAFILSQVVAQNVENVKHLWMASSLIGLSYGAVFGLLPVIVIEWFGLGKFSQVRDNNLARYYVVGPTLL